MFKRRLGTEIHFNCGGMSHKAGIDPSLKLLLLAHQLRIRWFLTIVFISMKTASVEMTKYLSKHNCDSLPWTSCNSLASAAFIASGFPFRQRLWSCVLVVTFLPNGATSYSWVLQVLTHKKLSSLSDATPQNNW